MFPTSFDPGKRFLAVKVFLFLLLAFTTLATSLLIETIARREKNKNFYLQSSYVASWVEERMKLYSLVMDGIQTHFSQNQKLDAATWHNYFNNLNLEQKYPGFFSFSYVSRVNASDRQSFVTKIRSQTQQDPFLKDFSLYPTATTSADSWIVTYVRLKDISEKPTAIGYDASSDPIRSSLTDQAITTGKPVVSGKVDLLTTRKPGFYIVLPVYQPNSSLETTEQRRQAAKGLVVNTYVGEELFRGILEDNHSFPDLDFEIYLTESADKDQVIYDRNPDKDILEDDSLAIIDNRKINLPNGQAWTLVSAIHSKVYPFIITDSLALVILILGTLISLIAVTLFPKLFFQKS